MTRRRRMTIWLGLLACSLAGTGVLTGASRPVGAEKHLYVWAGDQARKAPDFLAVVNFDEASPDYGKLITTVPLPNPGEAGNEPHHVGLSADGRTRACGGLLSVLKAQQDVFFFDGPTPRARGSSPRPTRRNRPSPTSSIRWRAAASSSR